jgi:hypothetical protein
MLFSREDRNFVEPTGSLDRGRKKGRVGMTSLLTLVSPPKPRLRADFFTVVAIAPIKGDTNRKTKSAKAGYIISRLSRMVRDDSERRRVHYYGRQSLEP